VRVHLKGIHSATKRLADGRRVVYHYAWKTGPRLQGEPGSPEFVASYHAAISARVTPPPGMLKTIITQFQQSQAFHKLADSSRKAYVAHIRSIEREFGDLPLAALSDPRTRGVFREWRDKIALTSQRQADYRWSVLARILSWALSGGLIPANPCERGGRVYCGSRADKVWSHDDETHFLKSAGAHLHLPLLLALWTGQRQGDLLKLPWSGYYGTHIRLRQSKTNRRVVIPVGAPLKVALDAAAKSKCSPVILTNSEGKPWTSDGFRCSWRKACAAAGIVGLTFNDLRGTAVTRLALAEATEAEIATITGHSLHDVRSILDSHYLHRDPALATSAIRKLEESEQRTKTTN
jgi:integrase